MRDVAIRNLKRFGSKARRAIPTLLKKLRSTDAKVISMALSVLRYTGLTRGPGLRHFSHVLFGKHKKRRIEALATLKAMGADAAPALHMVRKALRQSAKGIFGENGTLHCVQILRHIGNSPTRLLSRLLQHPRKELRDKAMVGLLQRDPMLRYRTSVKKRIIYLLERQLGSSDEERILTTSRGVSFFCAAPGVAFVMFVFGLCDEGRVAGPAPAMLIPDIHTLLSTIIHAALAIAISSRRNDEWERWMARL